LLLALIGLAAMVSVLGAEPRIASDSPQRLFQWRPFLAPFHAVVLHFPIGFMTLAFILEVYSIRRPSEELRRITKLVTCLSLVVAVFTASFGMLRAESGEYEIHAVRLHRAFGLCVPILIFATLAAQNFAYRRTNRPATTFIYRTLLSGTLAVIVIAGHLGGNLTHGSRYLVENAPTFVRKLIGDVPDSTPNSQTTLSENERSYAEKVQPILAAKCYNCHGPQKQKGGYRLDHPEIALKGGESGEVAIKPGDPMQSHLVRRILLAPGHDDAMPPEGKEPLAMEEIVIILDWVRKGAAFSVLSKIPDPIREGKL
jgi:uncharacterized membrane protein